MNELEITEDFLKDNGFLMYSYKDSEIEYIDYDLKINGNTLTVTNLKTVSLEVKGCEVLDLPNCKSDKDLFNLIKYITP